MSCSGVGCEIAGRVCGGYSGTDANDKEGGREARSGVCGVHVGIFEATCSVRFGEGYVGDEAHLRGVTLSLVSEVQYPEKVWQGRLHVVDSYSSLLRCA